MSVRRRGIALQILGLLAEKNFPGLTRGEIRTALELPPDVEITMRVRELRTEMYGAFDVRVEKISKTEFTYWLPPRERARAKAILAKLEAA
jgi:hypothetical protein